MEEAKKISVKDRMLSYAKLTNLSVNKLAEKIGVSPGILRPSAQKSSISVDSVVIFLTVFDEISPNWLLLGTGPMFKKSVEDVAVGDIINTADHNSTASFIYNQAHTLSAQKDAAIHQRDETIANLQQTISALQALVNSQQQHIQLLQECASRTPRQYPCSENLAGDAQTPNYQPSTSAKIGTNSEHNP